MAVPRILVVGSLNMDLITRTPVVPAGGETLTASSFSTGPGGKGANQAVACARASRSRPSQSHETPKPLLAEVSMIGAVGDDLYGRQLVGELYDNDINALGVETLPGEVSGVAVIIVEESSGENRILVTPGANGLVQPTAFEQLVVHTQVDLVVLQLEIPLDTVLAILKKCKSLGIDCMLNPAPAVRLPTTVFDGLAYLVMNETEAGILCGWGAPSAGENDLRQVFDHFEGLGVRNTIVTLGSRGVAWGVGNGKFEKIPAEKVPKVVDTTAAGDTFVGSLAVSAVVSKFDRRPLDLRASVEKANRVAAKTVEKAGAMQSIPWLDEY